MSNKQCVGCGSATEGVYRLDANWDLCDECYEVWEEEQVADREEENAQIRKCIKETESEQVRKRLHRDRVHRGLHDERGGAD